MSNNQQNARGWQEVGGGGTKTDHSWKPGQAGSPEFIMGYFKGIEERSGPSGPFLVAILFNPPSENAKEYTIGVSVGYDLKNKLSDIGVGEYICIKYVGTATSKRGFPVKNFSVMVNKNAVPWNFEAMNPDFNAEPKAPLPPVSQAPSNPAPQAQAPVQPQMPPQRQFVPPVNTQQAPPTSAAPMTQRTPPAATIQPSFPAQGWPASDGNDDLPF